jgi:hypothetical protein
MVVCCREQAEPFCALKPTEDLSSGEEPDTAVRDTTSISDLIDGKPAVNQKPSGVVTKLLELKKRRLHPAGGATANFFLISQF